MLGEREHPIAIEHVQVRHIYSQVFLAMAERRSLGGHHLAPDCAGRLSALTILGKRAYLFIYGSMSVAVEHIHPYMGAHPWL